MRSAEITELHKCVRIERERGVKLNLHLDKARCLCSAGVCWSMKSSIKGNAKKVSEAAGTLSPSPGDAQKITFFLATMAEM